MKRFDSVALLTAGALVLSAQAGAQPGLPELPALPTTGTEAPAAPADPAVAPAVPSVPEAPAAPTAPGVPALPALPTLPGAAPAAPAFPGSAPAAAVPTPPPLGNQSGTASMDSASAATGGATATAAAPSQLYTFLFIEDPEYGIVRQKFTTEIAAVIKEKEIEKYQEKRRSPQAGLQQPGLMGMGTGMVDPAMIDPTIPGGGGMNAMGMDPAMMGAGLGAGQGMANNAEAVRAAAEWDFYYSQLEMYDRYVREKLIPEAEDLPELSYDSNNVLQERQDLFEAFQDAAIIQGDEESNENRDFYERLQRREDRRIAYNQWLMHKENELTKWTEDWSRNVNGQRWTDGEEVRVDDWYYGIDFNSAAPVTVAMDNREFVVSRQPVENLKPGQLNVISSNLTPYDIIDNNGYLKNPQMETLRGTLVIPPANGVAAGSVGGTIEVVPGLGAE